MMSGWKRTSLSSACCITWAIAAGCAADSDQELAFDAWDRHDGADEADGFAADFGENRGEGCNDLEVDYQETTPNVILLVDRSSSMFDSGYGASPTRWAPLYDALMAPHGPVDTLQGDIRFGFSAYTAGQGSCPGLESVPPSLDNHTSIDTLFQQLSTPPAFKAETPTGAAIQEAVELLEALQDDGSKYIILATDGEPDTCAHMDPQCGQDESIKAVQDAFARGIRTIVLGIGSEVGSKQLRDLANAGTGQAVEEPSQDFISTCVNGGLSDVTASYAPTGGDANFYHPTDPAGLGEALASAIGGVRSCVFELSSHLSPDAANQCTVLLDGQVLSHGVDWHMNSETNLELAPSTCQDLQGAETISISCPCDVVIL